MTARDFAYWLQGYFEIGLNHIPIRDRSFTPDQIEMIQKHLNLVFIHEIDPSINQKHSKKEVDKMNEIHKFTLQELGEEHGFTATDGFPSGHGPSPGPGYKLSTLHGWYKESEGTPRC